MNKVVISAPFGNYLSFAGCTSTLGTFTMHCRGGLAYRLWRCLLTLRYNRRIKAWTNRLGLPNPGVDSLPRGMQPGVVSIHGFDAVEWMELASRVTVNRWFNGIEFNLSCPNVGHRHYREQVIPAMELVLKRTEAPVIAKLPPVRWMDFAVPLRAAGVRYFHCCNTIPSPGGGISGKPLKQYSLWAVDEIKQKWGDDVKVIGGGGISGPDDALDYRRAGADHVAIGSMLLNPFNWRKVKRIVEAVG